MVSFLQVRDARQEYADIAALCLWKIWGDNVDLEQPHAKPARRAADRRTAIPPSEVPTPQEITATLAGDAGVRPTLELRLGGKGDNWLHVLHRQAKQDVFLVCNQNHQGAVKQFKFRATAQGEPECWDAMRNTITTLPFQRIAMRNTGQFALTMEPLESVLIVFQPKRVARPMRIEPGTKPVREPIVSGLAILDPTRPKPPAAKIKSLTKVDLAGASGYGFPKAIPAAGSPPGVRYFRQTITIPADRNVTQACFLLTADNAFDVYVNGANVGNGNEWKQLRVRRSSHSIFKRVQMLAIAAINGGQVPNPAGLLGRFIIDFDQGPPLTGTTDKTWKTSRHEKDWNGARLDDSTWGGQPKRSPTWATALGDHLGDLQAAAR